MEQSFSSTPVVDRGRPHAGWLDPVIGTSPAMQRVYALIEQAAPTAASMLISGESGTGKELVARTIHRLSRRAAFPFMPIDCATIPETLLESELFGYEKGAFTGAAAQRAGCFEMANRGTLFLDELADTAFATQAKLLRVLQERRFRRVGGRCEQAVDVRIIAATNVDPLEAVKTGKLRGDLYYRLNVFPVTLPPLRDRREDLPLLVQFFLNEFNGRYGKSIEAADPAVMRLLEGYSWPGNVRELRNVIERATILTEGNLVEPQHLPMALTDARRAEPMPRTLELPLGTTVYEAERQLILLTLEFTSGNQTHAAQILGISVKALSSKLSKVRFRERHLRGPGRRSSPNLPGSNDCSERPGGAESA